MPRPAPDKRSPLGARLKAARLQVGYETAREAARVCGIHEATYRDIEGGKDPRFLTLEKIVTGLGLDPRDLFPGWDGKAE